MTVKYGRDARSRPVDPSLGLGPTPLPLRPTVTQDVFDLQGHAGAQNGHEPPSFRSKMALVTDLLARLEMDTDVPWGASGSGLTQEEIGCARSDVAKDMGS